MELLLLKKAITMPVGGSLTAGLDVQKSSRGVLGKILV